MAAERGSWVGPQFERLPVYGRTAKQVAGKYRYRQTVGQRLKMNALDGSEETALAGAVMRRCRSIAIVVFGMIVRMSGVRVAAALLLLGCFMRMAVEAASEKQMQHDGGGGEQAAQEHHL